MDELYSHFSIKWTSDCQASFDGLKTALSSEPVLRLPDFDKPFEVVADACTSTPAIGAVLLQSGHPVAFYSRKCTGAEGNYSASDLEMLAVIAALKEWRPYLQGGPRFKIVTDHLPNTYVDSASVSSHTLQRRARWLEISSCYDYEWEYRPGRLNVADPISRAPAHFHSAAAAAVVLQASTEVLTPVGQPVSRPSVAASGSANPGSRALVARLRLALPTGTALMCCLCAAATRSRTRSAAAPAPVATPHADDGPHSSLGGEDAPVQGELPNADTALSDDEMLNPPGPEEDIEVAAQFTLENFTSRIQKGCEELTPPASTAFRTEDCLYYQGDCIYIPDYDNLRKECFEAAHSHLWSGHFGVRKTLKRLQSAYWWPHMQHHVENWIRQCDSCQRNKFQRIAPPGKLQPLHIPEMPWTSISMDWITCLPTTSRGYDAILVVVDRFSKLTHFIPCNSTDGAVATAVHLRKDIVRLHGIPKEIVSDRDSRFTAKVWRSLADLLNFKQKLSTSRHPQTDGQTENMNQQLEDFLRHFIGPLQNDWDDLLPAAEFAINSSWQSSINTTPFQLTYGYNPRSPATAHLDSPSRIIQIPGLDQFRSKWFDEIRRAREYIRVAQDRQKAAADRKRSKAPEYKEGDQVLLKTPFTKLHKHLTKKLSPRWLGPFCISKVIGDSKSAVKLVLPSNFRIHPVFHVSQIRPYHHAGAYQPPSPSLWVEGEPLWQVEYLMDHQQRSRAHWYKVKWEGYDEPTWEPLKNLDQAESSIKEFWESKGKPVPHRLLFDSD